MADQPTVGAVRVKWYEREPTRWAAECRIAGLMLDGCRSGTDGDGVAFHEGVFHVRSRHGHTYDSVTVRVDYPDNFPAREQSPRVVLLSHRDRWQNTADAHIFSDWTLCLYVPGEAGIDFSRPDSLNDLFAVLHTYLFKQIVFQSDLRRQVSTGRVAEWPGPERAHGLAGIAEAVRDRGRVGRNEACPCGSGLKFKACCLRKLKG